jgi:DNA repair exonuclease SbcCD ATPase subunit
MTDDVYDDDSALLAELENEAEGEPLLEEGGSEPSPQEPAKPAVPTEKPDADEVEEPYSKRVQKRINKFTKQVRELEQANQFWQERVSALEKKIEARESDAFAKELTQTEQQLKAEIESARAAKRRAIEEGDIDAQIKADEHLLDLREQMAEQRRTAESLRKSPEGKEPERPAPPPAAPPLPEGTQRWLKENEWFMKGSDPHAAEAARLLDVALQEEGYDPSDPEMYEELDRRLIAAMPRLAKLKSPTAQQKAPVRPPRSAVAGSSADGQSAAPAKAATRRLTQEDLVSMRRFGYDPRNENHRRSWLKRNDPLF